MPAHIPEGCKEVIKPETCGQGPPIDPATLMNRKDERAWPNEVRGDPEQHAAFVAGLEHQSPMAVLEVTKAAMDES